MLKNHSSFPADQNLFKVRKITLEQRYFADFEQVLAGWVSHSDAISAKNIRTLPYSSVAYDSFSRNMFTQFLDTRKDSSGYPTTSQHKKETEMPTHVLGMSIQETLSMFGLVSVNATNAGCLLVLVLRLRQCCAHLSLMCEVRLITLVYQSSNTMCF